MHVQTSRTRLLLAQPRTTHSRENCLRSSHRRPPRRHSGEEHALQCRGAPATPGAQRNATSMARHQAPGHLLRCSPRAGSARPQHGAGSTRGVPAVVVPGDDLQRAREAHAAAAPAAAAVAAAAAPARAALWRACASITTHSNQLPSPADRKYESELLLTVLYLYTLPGHSQRCRSGAHVSAHTACNAQPTCGPVRDEQLGRTARRGLHAPGCAAPRLARGAYRHSRLHATPSPPRCPAAVRRLAGARRCAGGPAVRRQRPRQHLPRLLQRPPAAPLTGR